MKWYRGRADILIAITTKNQKKSHDFTLKLLSAVLHLSDWIICIVMKAKINSKRGPSSVRSRWKHGLLDVLSLFSTNRRQLKWRRTIPSLTIFSKTPKHRAVFSRTWNFSAQRRKIDRKQFEWGDVLNKNLWLHRAWNPDFSKTTWQENYADRAARTNLQIPSCEMEHPLRR